MSGFEKPDEFDYGSFMAERDRTAVRPSNASDSPSGVVVPLRGENAQRVAKNPAEPIFLPTRSPERVIARDGFSIRVVRERPLSPFERYVPVCPVCGWEAVRSFDHFMAAVSVGSSHMEGHAPEGGEAA